MGRRNARIPGFRPAQLRRPPSSIIDQPSNDTGPGLRILRLISKQSSHDITTFWWYYLRSWLRITAAYSLSSQGQRERYDKVSSIFLIPPSLRILRLISRRSRHDKPRFGGITSEVGFELLQPIPYRHRVSPVGEIELTHISGIRVAFSALAELISTHIIENIAIRLVRFF